MNEGKKISLPESVLLIMFGLIVDVLDFVPILGSITSLTSFFLLWFYFKIKGVNQTVSIVSNLVDIIPIVEIIPATTAGIVATIIIDQRK